MQIILTLGIVVAQAINLGTQHIAGFGWRISLACAGIPAIVLTLGGLLLPDTPNSLIDRGGKMRGSRCVSAPGVGSGRSLPCSDQESGHYGRQRCAEKLAVVP